MGANTFRARRALERLREGLYDPYAVRLLTAHHEEIDARLDADLGRLNTGKTTPLCICGPYGQGKSHTLTYFRERALDQGYLVSAINLDPREAPLHQFRQVYRALLETLTFPTDRKRSETSNAPTSLIEAWQAWANSQSLPSPPEDRSVALAALLPDLMPHPFKAILVALAQTTLPVPAERRGLKRYRDYRPMAFPSILRRALLGDSVPVLNLRPALKYRQVSFYRQASLALRGHDPYVQMIAALAQLFQQMGYPGWVLLFDEGEAMIQMRSQLRALGYRTLHQLLAPAVSPSGFYPVFAFTPDFFQRVQDEDYDLPYFNQDYADAWRDVPVYHLRSLSRGDWEALSKTLIDLHREAYQWHPDSEHLLSVLNKRLDAMPLEDTRITLKALVDELDQAQQLAFFAALAKA